MIVFIKNYEYMVIIMLFGFVETLYYDYSFNSNSNIIDRQVLYEYIHYNNINNVGLNNYYLVCLIVMRDK